MFLNSKTQDTISLLCLVIVQYVASSEEYVDAGEPLFLSRLINLGYIEEAQNLSQVKGILPEGQDTLSYSGFITVNELYNTNLFFWFFPATNKNPKNAPVIFWSDGGPGTTLFNSLFNMNGPYTFSKDKELEMRNESSWNSEFNIIYLDNPAGVGFSFTENESGYANSGRATAPEVYQFLIQFFKLFPELADNDFYNGGCSYGGIYATSIAHYIHTRNLNSPTENEINLKGIILDSPWINPIDQIDYGNILYNAGLIGKKGKDSMDKKSEDMRNLIKKQKYSEAFEIWFTIIVMDVMKESGFAALYDIIDSDRKDSIFLYNYTDLVTQESFRKALHVGNRPFTIHSQEVQQKMKRRFMSSVKGLLEELLDADYKILTYAGNLDVITGHLGIEQSVEHLEWKGADLFAKTDRNIWKTGDDLVAGYIRGSDNLKYVLVRNAGHGCSYKQPERVLNLVKSFIEGSMENLRNGEGNEDETSTTSGVTDEL